MTTTTRRLLLLFLELLFLVSTCTSSTTTTTSGDARDYFGTDASTKTSYLNWLSSSSSSSSSSSGETTNQQTYTNHLYLSNRLDSPNQAHENINVYIDNTDMILDEDHKNGVALFWYFSEEEEEKEVDGTKKKKQKKIHLAMAARASEWLLFGLGSATTGADVALFTLSSTESENESGDTSSSFSPRLMDGYVTHNGIPQPDLCEHWTLERYLAENGFLIFEASRLLDTGDVHQDFVFQERDARLEMAPTPIVVAWGDDVRDITIHKSLYHVNDGWLEAHVRFFHNTQKNDEHHQNTQHHNSSPLENNVFRQHMQSLAHSQGNTRGDGTIMYTIDLLSRQFEIPNQHATTLEAFCFTTSDIEAQLQLNSAAAAAAAASGSNPESLGLSLKDIELSIVGMEPITKNPKTKPMVRQIMVYAKDNLSGGSAACHDPFWENLIYVWSMGQDSFALPKEMGITLGGTNGGALSFLMEITYYNPPSRESSTDNNLFLLDDSGVRFYATTRKRPHEMGILQLGDPDLNLYGLPINFIGGSDGNNNNNNGGGLVHHDFNCPESCTNAGITNNDNSNNNDNDNDDNSFITVVREFHHLGSRGVRMVNSQTRHGRLIRHASTDHYHLQEDIADTSTFTSMWQQEPYQVHRGDAFRTSCIYQSTSTSTSTSSSGAEDSEAVAAVFGVGPTKEVCAAYLYYYPKVSSKTSSSSSTSSSSQSNNNNKLGNRGLTCTYEDPTYRFNLCRASHSSKTLDVTKFMDINYKYGHGFGNIPSSFFDSHNDNKDSNNDRDSYCNALFDEKTTTTPDNKNNGNYFFDDDYNNFQEDENENENEMKREVFMGLELVSVVLMAVLIPLACCVYCGVRQYRKNKKQREQERRYQNGDNTGFLSYPSFYEPEATTMIDA